MIKLLTHAPVAVMTYKDRREIFDRAPEIVANAFRRGWLSKRTMTPEDIEFVKRKMNERSGSRE